MGNETSEIKIISEWEDELYWCPSQCYLKMIFNHRYFLLYLRWRHSDPWTATLIECDADFYMHNKKYDWIKLKINYWKDKQINEAKENSIEVAKKIICDTKEEL